MTLECKLFKIFKVYGPSLTVQGWIVSVEIRYSKCIPNIIDLSEIPGQKNLLGNAYTTYQISCDLNNRIPSYTRGQNSPLHKGIEFAS